MRIFGWGIIGFFVELAGFVWFAQTFGFLALVIEIFVSALLGVILLRSALSGEALFEVLREMKNPKDAMIANFNRIIGSILLIIPGIVGDIVGLLMQFGVLDFVWERLLAKIIFRSYQPQNREEMGEIIDAEIIEGNIEYEEKSHHRK